MITSNERCKHLMIELGACVDKLAARGLQSEELDLCGKIANGIYLICLHMNHIAQSFGGECPEVAFQKFDAGIAALHRMLEIYASTEDGNELERFIDGMRAAFNYQEAKREITRLLNAQELSHSDRESLASKDEQSHG